MPKAKSRPISRKAQSGKTRISLQPKPRRPRARASRFSEIDALRRQLEEAQQTLRAITSGEVDALVVAGPAGDQVYTLKDADRPYRHLAEQMQEGACTLNPEGIILFTNSFFAQLLGVPMEHVMGTPFARWVRPHDQPCLGELLEQSQTGTARGEIALVGASGEPLPVELSLSRQQAEEGPRTTAVVFDLRERKQSEQALRRINQELEQRVAERTAQLRAANEELEVANEELEVANEEQKVANDELAEANRHLAHEIAERKRGEALIQSLATIPAENPNPVLRLTAAGVLLYANPASAPVLADWNASVGQMAPEFWRELVAEAYASQKARTVDVPIADRIYAFSVAPIPETGYVNLYGRDITTTVRAQESLREALQGLQQAEQKANDLIRYAPTAIYEIDFRGPRFTHVNDAMCAMSGYPREELLAMSPFALLDLDSQKRFQERIRKTLAGEPIDETVEYRALVNEGRELYVTLQTRLIYENGKAVGAFVIGHDVTQRKHSEQQLRDSEARFRVLAEVMPQVVWSADASGAMDYYNARTYEYGGLQQGDINGWDWAKVMHPDDLAPTAAAWSHSLATGEPYEIEQRLRRSDGEYRWHLTRGLPLRDEQGCIVHWIGTATDIHDQKQIEAALRESEKRYRLLHESLRDPFVQVAMDGRLVEFNNLYCDMLGYSPEELRALTYRDLTPERWHAFEDRIVRDQIMVRGYSDVYEKEYRSKDGTIIPVELRTILSCDDEGQPTAMWGVVRDISERKVAEELVRRLNQELEQRAQDLEAANEELRVANEEQQTTNEELHTANTQLHSANAQLEKEIAERKRVEEALRGSEEQYRNLVESSNSIIMRADENLNITYMNPFGLAYFGYTAEELIGKNVMGTTIPRQDDAGRDLSTMVQDIKQNPDKYKTNLHQNMRKNGELVWVSWTNKVTYDRDGKFVDILAIGNDIDQIRRAEEAQRQSEALLQAVLDSTPDPVYIKDHASRILLANEALARVVGKPLDQIIGKTDSEYYDNATVGQALRDHDLEIMSSAASASFEETVLTPEGERTFLSSKAPYRNAAGEIVGITGISRDITERKRMEEALWQATRQAENDQRVLESVIQQMPAGVILTDATGAVARNNKAMDRIWRREMRPTENVDQHGYVAYHSDGREYQLEEWPLTRSLRGGEEIIGEEMVILRGDGTKGTVYVSSAPVRDNDDKIIAGVVIDVDISELKQAEELIQRLNRQLELRAGELELANKELESFSYSVSHDLRAPLASINGFANLLLKEQEAALPDNARRLVDLIQKNSAEMSQLVDGLLRFSRSIRQPLTKQTVDLNSLARQVLDDLKAAQAGRHVDISIGDLPTAQADPVLLKQVLTNLLSNALKFTRQREVARIEVGSTPNVAGELVYHVRDNGVGFDAAHAPGLFGVFQRFHSEEDYEGTGIGLAIVERIVRRHGGRVWAESEADQGATFYFTLPA